MLIRADRARATTIRNCHNGSGALACRAFGLNEAGCGSLLFLHDDLLEPGAVIGEHAHEEDEEIYYVLEGRGTMTLDGERFEIGPGDLAVTPAGHSHGLVNGQAPMRLIVACARSPG